MRWLIFLRHVLPIPQGDNMEFCSKLCTKDGKNLQHPRVSHNYRWGGTEVLECLHYDATLLWCIHYEVFFGLDDCPEGKKAQCASDEDSSDELPTVSLGTNIHDVASRGSSSDMHSSPLNTTVTPQERRASSTQSQNVHPRPAVASSLHEAYVDLVDLASPDAENGTAILEEDVYKKNMYHP